jgi:type VI secretion system protein ImpF
MMQTREQFLSPLLHRLTDESPNTMTDSATRHIDLQALRNDIKRNIVSILNQRVFITENELKWPQAHQSILQYGVPNISQPYFGLSQNQLTLCANIESSLKHFEKRLKNIVVTPTEEESHCFRFRIEAMVNDKAMVSETVFEPELDIVSQQFRINED